MAGISSLGVGSGLDIRGLVDQLVAAERAPVQNRLDRREARLQAELSSFGSLKSALNDFRGTVDALSDASDFRVMRASSGNSDAIGVSAADTAQAQSLDVQVNSLAQAQSVASGGFASTTDAVGSGTLTFRFGTVTTDAGGAVTDFAVNGERPVSNIEIPAGANTLEGVRDAVNDAGIGVRASIINDGSAERLVFSADDSGAANGFVVEVADDDGNHTDAAGLSQLAFNTAASNSTRGRAGSDAELVVDGLAVSRASNTVDDLVEGLTLTLKDTTATAVRLDVSQDTGAVRAKIQGFVDGFNALQDQIDQIAGFNSDSGQGAVLQGDATVRTLNSTLRRQITGSLQVLEGRAVRSLADLGITTDNEGRLAIDGAGLDDALENHFDEVGALFGVNGIAEGTGFRFESSRSDTVAGDYAVNVSQLAERAAVQGSAITAPSEISPLTIGAGNDTLSLTVDGIASGEISLTQGDYTSGASLAADLQSRINGSQALQDAGASVAVSFDEAAGTFSITSQRFGSESEVRVNTVDTTTAATLGLDTSLADTGVDVAGTVGGVTGEGFGRFLTPQSGNPAGLKLEITGQSTGALGSVTFSRGLSDALLETLDGYLDSDGLLDLRTEAITDRVEDIGEARADLADRLQRIERRFIDQFSAMDALVGQLQSTQQFLSGQLANLDALSRQSNGGGQ